MLNSPNPVDGDVQVLIADCQAEIAELEKRLTTWGEEWIPYLQSKLKRQQVALAALTAEPVDFRWRWARDDNAVWTYCHMDKYQDAINAFADNAKFELVYTTPPAQLLRTVELPDDFSEIRIKKAKLWIDRVMLDMPGMKEAKTCAAILDFIAEVQRLNATAQPVSDWQKEAERMAELHGMSFVVFRNGGEPKCVDPTKVRIEFTDKGLGYPAAPGGQGEQ